MRTDVRASLPFGVLLKSAVGVDFALRDRPYAVLWTAGRLMLECAITIGAVGLHALHGVCEVVPAVEVCEAEVFEGQFDAALVTDDGTEFGLAEGLVLAFSLTDFGHAYAAAYFVDAVDGETVAAAFLDERFGVGEEYFGVADDVVVL